MTSSSSAASADEPRNPFGLGERRLGDVDPDPESPAGRAMGATGRVIGPGSFTEARRAPVIACVGEGREFECCKALEGGAIGAGGARLRPNAGSKGGFAPNVRGRAEGASGGGPEGIEGPATKDPVYGPGGANGSLGDMAEDGLMPAMGEYIGVVDD